MKYSCLICMGSGSLVNARTDLQLTIISCTHTDCPTFWVSIIGTFFNHWWILQVPKTRALRGLWGNTTPQNFEILMVWNPISIVQRGQFLSKMSLKLIICHLNAYLCLHGQALCISTWSYFIKIFLHSFLKFPEYQFLNQLIILW